MSTDLPVRAPVANTRKRINWARNDVLKANTDSVVVAVAAFGYSVSSLPANAWIRLRSPQLAVGRSLDGLVPGGPKRVRRPFGLIPTTTDRLAG